MVYENENENVSLPSYQFQQVTNNSYQSYDQQPVYHHPQMYDEPYNYQDYPYMNGPPMDPYMYANQMNPNMYANQMDPRLFQAEAQQQEAGTTNSNVMQQFLDENGNVDVQKMLQTVGQLADTVQQVSPVIRQLNDLVRSFRA